MNDDGKYADLREPIEDLQREYYKNAAWFFSKKESPTGAYSTLGNIAAQLETLNKNLELSSRSSEKLSKALHWLTACGVLVATVTLGFEIYKYCNS